MKKFVRRNLNLAKITGIASVIFVILFIIYYDTNDLFRLPFNSNVWGTASDWMMVVVTIITAIYLIKTFKQQKLATDIALSNHRRLIMPRLSINTFQIEKLNDRLWLGVNVNDNDLYNFRIEYHTNDFLLTINAYPNFLGNGQGIYLYVKKLNVFHYGDKSKVATFFFEDVEGNRYLQYLKRDGHFINIEAPLLNN